MIIGFAAVAVVGNGGICLWIVKGVGLVFALRFEVHAKAADVA